MVMAIFDLLRSFLSPSALVLSRDRASLPKNDAEISTKLRAVTTAGIVKPRRIIKFYLVHIIQTMLPVSYAF